MSEEFIVRGLRVPWITRWTSEVHTPGPLMGLRPTPAGQVRLSFKDETPSDRIDGVLWLRESTSPGVGEPMWKDVHSHRQRLCQVDGRCQVCGQRIAPPITWLIPPMLSVRHGRNLTTDVAPTCRECIEVTLRSCPALRRRDAALYEVYDYRLHAVLGDTLHSGPNGLSRHEQREVLLNSADIQHVMARQMIVELWNFRRRKW